MIHKKVIWVKQKNKTQPEVLTQSKLQAFAIHHNQMDFYKRKLYALLKAPELRGWGQDIASQLKCLNSDLISLQAWWGQGGNRNQGGLAQDISPTDWWAILLADGDGMGSYVSGQKLETYNSYIVKSSVEEIPSLEQLLNTQKRMGPATLSVCLPPLYPVLSRYSVT